MRYIVTFIVLTTTFTLAGCGFRPLYGEPPQDSFTQSITTYLSDIRISNIPDREGQYLRNALIDRFYRDGYPDNPRYTLDISNVGETRTELDLTKSADTTRAQLKLRTKIVLRDTIANKTVLQRDLLAITSYNVLQSQFTTRVSEDNARLNALDDLARQIETQLALYFKRGDIAP